MKGLPLSPQDRCAFEFEHSNLKSPTDDEKDLSLTRLEAREFGTGRLSFSGNQ